MTSSDLFRSVFGALSRFDWPTYQGQFLDELPLHMLGSLSKANPDFDRDARLGDIREKLRETSRTYWKNPEIYPLLYGLLLRNSDLSQDMFFERMEYQILDSRLDPAHTPNGFYRRPWAEPQVIQVADGALKLHSDIVVKGIEAEAFPAVFMPRSGLFDDVVGADVYYGADPAFDMSEAAAIFTEAAASLRRFSPELYEGFCDAIGLVALTSEPVGEVPRSFSARMFYAGGIFSAILKDNAPSLVENLVHEYYHQRLWLWWSIEAPEDLPPQDMTIRSPVTGADKSVQVMLHALMIYTSVCHYYDFALSKEPLPPPVRDWVEQRRSKLATGSRKLLDLLMEALPDRPETRRYVAHVGDFVPAV
jgi:hypothetical protein